eukprot:3805658-Lingulodinium_polyedra.AAC.1
MVFALGARRVRFATRCDRGRSAFHANTKNGVRVERATRAICDALRPHPVDSTASLCTVSKTVHNDA